MRYRIAAFVSIALVAAACVAAPDVAPTSVSADESSDTTAGRSPEALTSTTARVGVDAGSSSLVAGEVSMPSEAFCAGLSTTLKDVWEPGTVSEVFDEPVPYGACRAAGLPDVFEIPVDMSLQNAFANGCAIALTATLDPSMSLGIESDMEISWIACSRQFSEPEWSPGDYRVTIDGVCYLGYGPDAGVTGCQDPTGAYITTTTFTYTASDNLGDFLAFAATGPEVLTLTRNPAVAESLAQNWCASGVDFGTGDFAEWLTDLGREGAGRYGYAEEEYPDVSAFLWLLGQRAVDLLCPQIADRFRSDVEAVQNGDWPYNSDGELGGLGSTFAAWYGTALERYLDIYSAAPDEHWTDVGQAICTELDQGVNPDDRFLSLEAWLDAGAAPVDSLIRAANALHDAAISGLCPRHSLYYWSIVETGNPWWKNSGD